MWTHAPLVTVVRENHSPPLFMHSQKTSSAIPEYLGVYFAISEMYIMSFDLFWIYGILYHVKMMCEWSIVNVMCVCVFFFFYCAWFVDFNCD
jgi:hypothetical protein